MLNKLKLNFSKKKLEELNILLKEKCNDLSLSIHREDEDEIKLCVNYDGICISSIDILVLFHDTSIIFDITSSTMSNYGKRGFNKLLRAVVIILCKYINYHDIRTKYVTSIAENPISAYLMINYFYGIPSSSNRFTGESLILTGLIRPKDKFTPMNEIDNFRENSFPLNYHIETKVELNPENIENAMNVFKDVLNSPSFDFEDKNCIHKEEKTNGGKKRKTIRKKRKLCKTRKNNM